MARIKTFTNGGSLLPGDLNSIEDDYEFAFSSYRTLFERTGASPVAATAAIHPLQRDIGTNMPAGVAGQPAILIAFRFDLADWTATPRTPKLRVRAQCLANGTASGVTWTLGLYPVASFGTPGYSLNAAGAVVAGSTVAFANPGINTQADANSGDFTAPAVGWYFLGVIPSGAAAASSQLHFKAELQMRQV